MAQESENELNKGCNLIKAGTHEVFRRIEDNALFVKDKDLQFDFAADRALTQAQDTANSSFNSNQGCAGCPLYNRCLPTPSVISDPEKHKLIPALHTSFD